MDMSKYKNMFIEEAREHVKSITSILLTLENEPSNQDEIGNVFREYHSIKGMAASMGYSPITELSHSLEDLLDVVRKQKLSLPKSMLSLMFKGTDVLENMIEEIAADKDISESPSGLLQEIRDAEASLKAAADAHAEEIASGIILESGLEVEDIDEEEAIEGEILDHSSAEDETPISHSETEKKKH